MPSKKTLPLLAALAVLLTSCSGGDDPGTVANTGDADPSQPAPQGRVVIEHTGENDLSPLTPITVHAEHEQLTGVTVTNAESGNTVKGRLDAGKTTWKSSEPLGYGTTYRIEAKADNGEKSATQRGQLTTLTPKAQAEPNMIPAPGAVSSVGVGQPIAFQFTQPVRNKAEVEKHLAVRTEPAQEGSWYWIDDENVHYRPKEFWQPGTKISVSAKIYGVDFGGGVYGSGDRTESYTVHDSWVAKADGANEQMVIYHNGKQVRTMPISMGKDETPTHLGAHVISAKEAEYTMDSCTYGVCEGDPDYYRSLERWSLRISNDGEFVHENPNSVGQQGASNVSHGCINLNAENAQWFFEHFDLGDVVEVSNSGGEQLPVWDLYGDWSLSWHDWQQGSALT